MRKILHLILVVIMFMLSASCVSGGGDYGGNLEGGEQLRRVTVTVGDTTFLAQLENSQSADAFFNALPLTINMSDLNNNEKYYYFSEALPTNATRVGQIEVGDIMLYGNNCLVLFYESFASAYSYTRLGKIIDTTKLKQVIGRGSVYAEFKAA